MSEANTQPPAQDIRQLILELAMERARCSICGRDPSKVGFRLVGIRNDGARVRMAERICPGCVERFGYVTAIAAAMDVNERAVLAGSRDEGLEIRTAYRHLRGLLASGRIVTPPLIPAVCFADESAT